jgi:GR25 family glycosyltransferase involved in LPS biosynthesis
MTKISIDEYYMITLKTSERFKLHYQDDDFLRTNIKRFDAIDSRKSPTDTCNKYNYKIQLEPKFAKHFEDCRGAFGCAISHLSLCEIIRNKPTKNYYCILEDDVDPDSLKKFMKSDHILPNTPIIDLIGTMNSAAAYLINPLGAELLLKDSNNMITLPHDRYMFKYIRDKYQGWVTAEKYTISCIRNIDSTLS